MAKISANFPKDSCPISDARRCLAIEYLYAKRELELKEMWAEAFEKVAEKTFQVPYWRSYINASLPSSDASEISEAVGTFFWNKHIPNFGTRLGYGIPFPIQNTFIVPQLPKNSLMIVMSKKEYLALINDEKADEKSSYFYNFITDVYSTADKYRPWFDTLSKALCGSRIKEALHQLEEQVGETKAPAVIIFPFKTCSIFIIDDEEFEQDLENLKNYLEESYQLCHEFKTDTMGLPLYANLWKKPRGKEWKQLLYTTHGLKNSVGNSVGNKKLDLKALVKSGLFSEKQLDKALNFLKEQYNPDWKAVLASPHDGLSEELTPTFWKRTKLFAEYLTWTDLLFNRIINGKAYKDRAQLTENFPNMSQFSICMFMANSRVSSYQSYSNMSCKIPYRFPQPVLMTGYSEFRTYNLVSNISSGVSYSSNNVYRFPIGTAGWGPEDDIIAGPYELMNDTLTSSILKNCENLESRYKQAVQTILHAYKVAKDTDQPEVLDHILDTLKDYELNPQGLERNDFYSLY